MAKTYRATADGYADDGYVKAGTIFTTDAPKGSWMEDVEPAKDKAPRGKSAE